MSRGRRDSLAQKLEREPPALAGRVPPHDLDTEAAVLSALMLDEKRVAEVRALLEPIHCYSDANRMILAAVYWLADRNMSHDVLTVAEHLRQEEQIQRIGGASYLGQLVDATPAVANIAAHAMIVRNLWQVRRAIRACQHFAAAGYDMRANEAEGFCDRLAAEMFEIVQRPAQSPIVKLGEVVGQLERKVTSDDRNVELRGLSTTYADLDRKYRMRLGDVTIVAGRPGMGKTSYALCAALNVAGADPAELGETLPSGVAVMSLEMPREQVAARKVCVAASVSIYRLLNEPDQLTEAELAAVDRGARLVEGLPIWIDDTPALTLAALRAKLQLIAQKAKANGSPLRLVVIDYLQLMKGDNRASREQQISEISRGLKEIAKAMRVHVIALSQLNRAVEQRKPPVPMLSDLRESGSIEQDADAVLMFYRPDYYVKKGLIEERPDMRNMAQVIIEKQRNGPTGTVLLRFNGSSTAFFSLSPHDYPDRHDDDL